MPVLEPEGDAAGAVTADRCPRCATAYPRIDGIPCVPPDLEAFREAQAWALGPGFLHGDLEGAREACRLAGELAPDADSFRELKLLGQHALAHFPQSGGPLAPELEGNRRLLETAADWLASEGPPSGTRAGCALEAGCGPGALLQAVAPLFSRGALGLDLRVGTLRLARRIARDGHAFLPRNVEGRRFEPLGLVRPPATAGPDGEIHLVQGDVLHPPFEAEAFPAVLALSLLDTVPEPFVALGQLDALLAPGGLLLVGTPYSWDPRVTDPRGWWSGPSEADAGTLRDLLAGRHPGLPHLRYELLREERRVPWTVPGHDRLAYRYFLDLVLARKA